MDEVITLGLVHWGGGKITCCHSQHLATWEGAVDQWSGAMDHMGLPALPYVAPNGSSRSRWQ